jgi:hypothetical protein
MSEFAAAIVRPWGLSPLRAGIAGVAEAGNAGTPTLPSPFQGEEFESSREEKSGLRAVITLDDDKIDDRMRLTHFHIGLVFRRIVAGERRGIIRELDHDVA